MNRQRKVVITITYNEMGIIIDTKAEEVAQPNLQSTCNQLATDCISRQAAIAVADYTDYTGLAVEDVKKVTDEVVKGLKQLPSAQPEIIRCKDCKFWTHIKRTNRYWCKTDDGLYDLNPSPNDYCSRAERRTDEHSD